MVAWTATVVRRRAERGAPGCGHRERLAAMRVLVTGGAGFIGSNYVRRLLDGAYPEFAGAEVVVLD